MQSSSPVPMIISTQYVRPHYPSHKNSNGYPIIQQPAPSKSQWRDKVAHSTLGKAILSLKERVTSNKEPAKQLSVLIKNSEKLNRLDNEILYAGLSSTDNHTDPKTDSTADPQITKTDSESHDTDDTNLSSTADHTDPKTDSTADPQTTKKESKPHTEDTTDTDDRTDTDDTNLSSTADHTDPKTDSTADPQTTKKESKPHTTDTDDTNPTVPRDISQYSSTDIDTDTDPETISLNLLDSTNDEKQDNVNNPKTCPPHAQNKTTLPPAMSSSENTTMDVNPKKQLETEAPTTQVNKPPNTLSEKNGNSSEKSASSDESSDTTLPQKSDNKTIQIEKEVPATVGKTSTTPESKPVSDSDSDSKKVNNQTTMSPSASNSENLISPIPMDNKDDEPVSAKPKKGSIWCIFAPLINCIKGLWNSIVGKCKACFRSTSPSSRSNKPSSSLIGDITQETEENKKRKVA